MQLDDGAGQLADGAGEAKAGTTKLKDGSGQLADGSDQLADGLGDAADGSRQITDGLTQAADGAPKLVDGAQRLSDEGTSKLVEAGEDTAQNYGELYATIVAGAEKADASKMAYGAPEDAQALMAYSFVIEGENGEDGRNLGRGLAGLALLGAGAGAFAVRRNMA
jgi:putative membrane protein